MNDDFEKQLQRQPLRQMPDKWRAEILHAASSASGPRPSTLDLRPSPWWRELLWPNPQAWAGLAAAWVVIALLNLASFGPVPTSTAAAPAPSPEMLRALNEQKQLFAELIRSGELPPADRPKPFIPRPRGECATGFVTV